jgi:MFS transporter, DHA1 family, tetracycline resistance protein
VIYGAAYEGWMVWLGIPIASFWGLFNANAQSIMTKSVGPTEQGKLQGANTSIMAAANIVGPLIFTFAFSWAIEPSRSLAMPGLSFYLVGAALFLAALSTYIVTSTKQTTSK